MTDRIVAVLLAGAMLCVVDGRAAASVPADHSLSTRARVLLERRWPLMPTDLAVADRPAAAARETPDAMAPLDVRPALDDAQAWQRIATTQYLMGDVTGALGSWNRNGRPSIDAIAVHGAIRTRPSVLVHAAGLRPHDVLTPETFRRALRRVRDVPVVSSATMNYQAVDGGLAIVDVDIRERHRVPSGWGALGTVAARAIFLNELRLDVAGALGAGEVASAAWRWSAGRPRVTLGLALPAPWRLPGIVSIDGSWERQTYDATPTSDVETLVLEQRVRAGFRLSDWATSWLRVEGGAAIDRLREYVDAGAPRAVSRDYLALESSVSARLAGDRIAVTASGGWWAPPAGGRPFGTGALLATWRSTIDLTSPVWSAITGIGVASWLAPPAIWLGAGTGEGRVALLRAHRLVNSGVITGPVFGRGLAHASLEYARPVKHMKSADLSIAGFVDAAQAWHRLNGFDTSPLYVDAGVGLRVRTPGPNGAIRLDVAHGLRGGGTTFSASWGGAWRR